MAVVGSNSLFELRVYSELLGVNIQNRFWYFAEEPPDTLLASAVVTAFETEVAANWEGSVSEDWNGVRITCDELTSDQNFFDGACGIGPGTQSGDNMPPQACAGLRLLRSTKATRSGWKRLSGLLESHNTDGKLSAQAQTDFGYVLADFLTDLTVGAYVAEPVLVRKTYTGDPPVLNAPTAWVYNSIGSGVVIDDITTQNSRKFVR
jgi:hypothetical protein